MPWAMESRPVGAEKNQELFFENLSIDFQKMKLDGTDVPVRELTGGDACPTKLFIAGEPDLGTGLLFIVHCSSHAPLPLLSFRGRYLERRDTAFQTEAC